MELVCIFCSKFARQQSHRTPLPCILYQPEQGRHLLQGQAESYLEKLHKMVEQDLNDLLDGNRSTGDWPAFRETLIGLTDVTQVLSVALATGYSKLRRLTKATCCWICSVSSPGIEALWSTACPRRATLQS
jgi:hypothetical protein